MHFEPFFQGARGGKGGVKTAKIDGGEGWSIVHVGSTFMLHVLDIRYKIIDIWCWRIDISKKK